jgi:hypothetical protein
MGYRLGMNNAFPREEHVMHVDNKLNNNKNIKVPGLNDKLELNTCKQKSNVKFTGMSDSFSRAMEKVELGKFMAEFLLVDLIGMMVPRTYQAFMRNREELGHYNYKAGTEEAIRELLTGPSMTLMPILSLAIAKKYGGNGTQLDKTTLDKFTNIMSEVVKDENVDKSSKGIRKAFYGKIFDEITDPHKKIDNTAELSDISVKFIKHLENIENKQIEIKNLNKDNFTKKLNYGYNLLISKPIEFVKRFNDPLYEFEGLIKTEHFKLNSAIANEKKELVELISGLNKIYGISPENSHKINLLKPEAENMAKKDKNITKNINTLTNDLLNYSKGIIGRLDMNSLESSLNNERNKARGGRKLMLISTVLAISAVLYFIPALYKRNKQFPGIDGLVDEKTNLHSSGILTQGGGR